MASGKQTREQLPQEHCPPRLNDLLDTSKIFPTSAARLRVLLVDDNHANRLVASCILEERGHKVETASDAGQAIRLTQANRYDVILMDVEMPGMDGLEAMAAIRAAEQGTAAEKGTDPFCAQHPSGRSGKRGLSQYCSARYLLPT